MEDERILPFAVTLLSVVMQRLIMSPCTKSLPSLVLDCLTVMLNTIIALLPVVGVGVVMDVFV